MKVLNKLSKVLIFLAITFFSITIYAQTPTYECRVTNDLQVSPTVYQFDIYIYRTGSTVLNYNTSQLSLQYNNSVNLANGGTITHSLVTGSSELGGLAPISVSLLTGTG